MRTVARVVQLRQTALLCGMACMAIFLFACSKRVAPSVPPVPIDFPQALAYANRAALAYAPDATIGAQAGRDAKITLSGPLSSGIKAYVERNDAARVQWIVVRGSSNLVNARLDVDYNKLLDSRLGIPVHKGFGDAALDVYGFAKPMLKRDYETRVTGHSLGGAAAVIVLMLLKEDGFVLGPAMTFGQPKVTNRDGARKYQGLPLLRFVTAKDPVPLMPPFEVFAVLDEGPYVHIGPEVVLEEGMAYRYFSAHDAQRLSVLSFWENLKNLSLQDIPDHQIATYLRRVEQQITTAPK